MTLADKIRSRFGISTDCTTCVRKRRDCYTQNVSLNDICEVLRDARNKPVLINARQGNYAVGNCPNCGGALVKGYHPKFCGECGQAIEWE